LRERIGQRTCHILISPFLATEAQFAGGSPLSLKREPILLAFVPLKKKKKREEAEEEELTPQRTP
jgi:hypothetical protein